jgi:pimeloyl-ACP methyl ester carboxylesterase
MPLPETVEVEPRNDADASVVLLHGLGADGHDFESLVPELRLPASTAVRWVFPHAPVRPVTINGGARMRAWYDIAGFDRRGQDEAGIRESAETVRVLVDREQQRGIASDRVVLAGFSQGGAIALFATAVLFHQSAVLFAVPLLFLVRRGAGTGTVELNGARAWLKANQKEVQIDRNVWKCWRTNSLNHDRENGGARGGAWKRLFMSDAATAFAVLALSPLD